MDYMKLLEEYSEKLDLKEKMAGQKNKNLKIGLGLIALSIIIGTVFVSFGVYAMRDVETEAPIVEEPAILPTFKADLMTSDAVLETGAVYIPDEGIGIYTRVEDENQVNVVRWAVQQLLRHKEGFAGLEAEAEVSWLLEYGVDQTEKVVLKTKVSNIDNPKLYDLIPFEQVNSTIPEETAEWFSIYDFSFIEGIEEDFGDIEALIEQGESPVIEMVDDSAQAEGLLVVTATPMPTVAEPNRNIVVVQPTAVPQEIVVVQPTAVPQEIVVVQPTAVPQEIVVVQPTAVPQEIVVVQPTAVPQEIVVVQPTPVPQQIVVVAPTAEVVPVEIVLNEDETVETVPVVVGVDPDIVGAVLPFRPLTSSPVPVYESDIDSDLVGWGVLNGSWTGENGIITQSDTAGFDLISMLNQEPMTDYSTQLTVTMLDGAQGGGIIYHGQNRFDRAESQVVDFVEGGTYLRWGYYDENGDYQFVGGAPLDPGLSDLAPHQLEVVNHRLTTTIYFDDVPLATINNRYEGGYVGLVASQAALQFDNIDVISLPPDSPGRIETGRYYSYHYNDRDMSAWTPISGTWQVVDTGYQSTLLDGEPAAVSVSPHAAGDFDARLKLQVGDATAGGGLLFNMAETDRVANSDAVLVTEGGAQIIWGRFDANGVFTQTGQIPLATPGLGDGLFHELEIRAAAGTYSIAIDGELLQEGISFPSLLGGIGLVNLAGTMTFDEIQIEVAPVQTAAATGGGQAPVNLLFDFEDPTQELGWLPFDGDWVIEEGVYKQVELENFDRVTSFNQLMVGEYRLETQLRYVDGDMAAGFIFNMQNRDNKEASQVVAFTASGTFLQWGDFDEDGVFNYRGGVRVGDKQDGEWHDLRIDVRADSFDLYVDGDQIAANVPVVFQWGYTGLFVSTSEIEFDDLSLVGLGSETN